MNDGAVAAPAAGDAGAQPTGSAAAAPAAPWYGGLDGESQGWMQTKGWATPNGQPATDMGKTLSEMVKAHRSLESMNGRDKVVWPKDTADTQAWAEIHKRMGVPSKAEEYGLMPMGADGKPDEKADRTYANGMAAAFQKAGVGKEAAHALAAEHSKLSAGIAEADNAAFHTQSQADMASLRQEWGRDHDAKMASAQRATHAFGLDDAVLGKIERAIGTKDMMSLLSRIGGAVSEDFRGPSAGGGSTGPLSQEAASAEMSRLRSDQSWLKRYDSGDRAAIEEYNKLERIRTGQGAYAA